MFAVKGKLPIPEGELEFKGTLFKDAEDFQNFLTLHANNSLVVGLTAPAFGATILISNTDNAISKLTYKQLEN